MRVVTIFFCGTGFNRNRAGELIATLAKNCCGSEGLNWIIIDGPGGDDVWTLDKVRGLAFGKGWDENVIQCAKLLKTSQRRLSVIMGQLGQQIQAPMPMIVNMIGWSRGAVTAHMLANYMAQDSELKHVRVNIFAIDPVPGTLQFLLRTDRTRIRGNVANYFGVYARDELRIIMTPTLPSISKNTKSTLMSLPGQHSTLVLESAGPAAQITRWMAETCLVQWGTTFKDNTTLGLSHFQVLSLADKLLKNKKSLETIGRQEWLSWWFLGYNQRYVGVGNSLLSTNLYAIEQIKSDPVFINWAHRQLYKRLFPDTYNHFFLGGLLNDNAKRGIVITTFYYPDLFKRMVKWKALCEFHNGQKKTLLMSKL